MARVRIIKAHVRLTNYQVGDEILLPDSLAGELSGIGVTEIIEGGAAVETAALSGPQKAVIAKSRTKK